MKKIWASTTKRVAILLLTALLLISTFVSFMPVSASFASSLASERVPPHTVYAWLFGYVGDTFYPQTQLGLNTSQVLEVAANLSQAVGKNNLIVFPIVDEIPTSLDPHGVITSNMIPTIRHYVSEMKRYASKVYGRLDFLQYNISNPLSSNLSVYYQTDMYINKLGLSGVWFDRSPQYFANGTDGIGPQKFNQMMQNLTTMFPTATFVLNQAAVKFGLIHELPGYSWENETYLCPTAFWPGNGSQTLQNNFNLLQQSYAYFPNHLLLHMDADGPFPLENSKQPNTPMGIFGNLSSSAEEKLIQKLVLNGSEPSQFSGVTYSMVYPVIGSWTLPGPPYNETLYNSLAIGNYSRSTINSFMGMMKSYGVPWLSLSSTKGSVGKSVTVSGDYFVNASEITIYFNASQLATTSSGSIGNFTKSINIPASASGTYEIKASDGVDVISQKFTLTSKLTENSSSGKPGSTVKIVGFGFAANSRITVDFNGSVVPTKPKTVTSSVVGAFNAKFTIPNLASGQYSIQASDQSGNVVVLQFTIT